MKKTMSGFTIVELLIVIVVIAILATISVVAYNGIQNRAKYTQQVTEIDRVGKAIQLWSAENGRSLMNSGSGYEGNGWGSFSATGGSYTATSVHTLLTEAGYLSNFSTSGVNATILLSPCTTFDNSRWVVYATFSPAPTTSVADQISQTGCTNSALNGYTSAPYNRNFVKAY